MNQHGMTYHPIKSNGQKALNMVDIISSDRSAKTELRNTWILESKYAPYDSGCQEFKCSKTFDISTLYNT